jgi:hypothetical protein
MPTIDLPLTQLSGPIVSVAVFVSAPRIAALVQAKQQLPTPFFARGLVDTGASGTLIDNGVVTALGLIPTGSVPIHTPSTGNVPTVCDCYDVSLWFLPQVGVQPSSVVQPVQPHLIHPSHITLPVIGSSLAAQGIQLLIGRDILAHCHFIYDGKNNRFSLSFGP